MNQQFEINKHNFKIQYRGSLFWLIFWLIFFFPLAFVLLLTDVAIQVGDAIYDLRYNGSRFWLGFWVIFFFPIAFILLFVNGMTVTIEKPTQWQ